MKKFFLFRSKCSKHRSGSSSCFCSNVTKCGTHFKQSFRIQKYGIHSLLSHAHFTIVQNIFVYFHLSGCLDKQTCVMVDDKPPWISLKLLHLLHSDKVVWYAFSTNSVIAHYFIEDDSGAFVNTTSDHYVNKLRSWWIFFAFNKTAPQLILQNYQCAGDV